MLRITTKSGKHIDISEIDLTSILKDSIEELVDTHLSECTCTMNESNNHCECDGGIEDDDYEISQVSVVYIANEERLTTK